MLEKCFHLIWVRAILVRHDFRLPVTHQVHLGRRQGSGSPPSITLHGPLLPKDPPQGGQHGSEHWPGPTRPRSSLESSHQEPHPHLEVVQTQEIGPLSKSLLKSRWNRPTTASLQRPAGLPSGNMESECSHQSLLGMGGSPCRDYWCKQRSGLEGGYRQRCLHDQPPNQSPLV